MILGTTPSLKPPAVQQLPVEILCKILFYSRTRASKLNADEQTIRLSSVCIYWRRVIVGLCYSMWTNVTITPYRTEFAQLCFQRSGDRPLRVVLSGPFQDPSEIERLLRPHASRINSIRYHSIQRVTSFPTLDLSRLVRLHLRYTCAVDALNVMRSAPLLRECTLSDPEFNRPSMTKP